MVSGTTRCDQTEIVSLFLNGPLGHQTRATHGSDDPRITNCPGNRICRGDACSPCNRSIRQVAAVRPIASVGCAMALSPGPISGAHSGSSKPRNPTSVPNFQWRCAAMLAIRNVTTALPEMTAARRPSAADLARRMSSRIASSSRLPLSSEYSNTCPATHLACNEMHLLNAAARSRRLLTAFLGSVTYMSSR